MIEQTYRIASIDGVEVPLWVINRRSSPKLARLLCPQSRPSRCGQQTPLRAIFCRTHLQQK